MTEEEIVFIEEKGVDYSIKAPKEELESENESGNQVVDFKQPLFSSLHNPNKDIFTIETQEGASKDDQGHGSIGDATMEHVYKMSHRLPEMETFFKMQDGNLFRTAHNVRPMDEDGQKYNQRQMLETMAARDSYMVGKGKRQKVTTEDKENVIAFLKQEINERQLAREDKEDALDQTVVPYEQWEKMPQMTRDWDIPPTQAPLYIYAGNASYPFYDYVPEDHPDVRSIRNFITRINNIDWDDFTENTATYYKGWLFENPNRFRVQTAAMHLADFCDLLATPENEIHPDKLLKDTLSKIEDDWTAITRTKIMSEFQNSVVSKDLNRFEQSLQEENKEGTLLWGKIGEYGKTLYKKYGSNVTTSHWRTYRKLKQKYAPRVVVNGVDVNKASYRELKKALTRENADKMFFSRPFLGLQELIEKQLITIDDIGFTQNNVVFITQIKVTLKKALGQKAPSLLGLVARQIFQTQQSQPNLMTQDEWSAVWQTYRIAKKQVEFTLGLTS